MGNEQDLSLTPSIIVRFEDMLKPPQAAAKLGICKSHLRELSISGKIPAIDLGRGNKHMFRYHGPTLDAWVAKKMRMSVTDWNRTERE